MQCNPAKVNENHVVEFSLRNDFLNYILSINVKDGKYMAQINGFDHEGEVIPSRYGTGRYRSYGDLQADTKKEVMLNGTKQEDKHYYVVKNEVMLNCKALLADLREKMHQPPKDF